MATKRRNRKGRNRGGSPDAPERTKGSDQRRTPFSDFASFAPWDSLPSRVFAAILDNAALGLVRQQQTLFYRQRLVASPFAQPGNFVGIARAFGVPGIDLETCVAPHGTLARLLTVPGPQLIRVPIAAEHRVLPMVVPGAANTQALDHFMAERERRGEP
ncbi:thiamine pyrophosphate-dependent enzyme [Povalibacter sp.]|uniref:thiamine pyrophosphate-dependent enzyme n=1 Tax=Povalibacter sp. TaxID=1962978 RepID=UPI0039C9228A